MAAEPGDGDTDRVSSTSRQRDGVPAGASSGVRRARRVSDNPTISPRAVTGTSTA